MKEWREEKTRTSPTPAMGEAWCCAVEGVGGGRGEVLKVCVSNKDAKSSNPRWCHPDGESLTVWLL